AAVAPGPRRVGGQEQALGRVDHGGDRRIEPVPPRREIDPDPSGPRRLDDHTRPPRDPRARGSRATGDGEAETDREPERDNGDHQDPEPPRHRYPHPGASPTESLTRRTTPSRPTTSRTRSARFAWAPAHRYRPASGVTRSRPDRPAALPQATRLDPRRAASRSGRTQEIRRAVPRRSRRLPDRAAPPGRPREGRVGLARAELAGDVRHRRHPGRAPGAQEQPLVGVRPRKEQTGRVR
ncbi:MAG: hypothetical protein QOE27_1322, partial [Solirubrobacteraceae bacterium]|nr:hypothetical protein [Solirubrobacteraceae bacterium]